MNLQRDIRSKVFYAKKLPETFPVSKTIRQHYVSQKYDLDAFSSLVSSKVVVQNCWSDWHLTGHCWNFCYFLSPFSSVLYHWIWGELRKLTALSWNKTWYQTSIKNIWVLCMGNMQQFYVHKLKNERWDVKVSVGVFTCHSGYFSQKIFGVSKVVKIIIRKFREHGWVSMVKLSRKIAYGRPANWSWNNMYMVSASLKLKSFQ